METLAEGLLRRNGGPPNDFPRMLEGFLKLWPPTFDSFDDDPIVAEDWLRDVIEPPSLYKIQYGCPHLTC